jgi:hypothetical protein
MSRFISNGGIWDKASLVYHSGNKEPAMIKVTKFEDGMLMLHDGHHRAVASILAGRDYLVPDEYVLQEMTYAHYRVMNLDAGWITPHDPLTQVRFADWSRFREMVKLLQKNNGRLSAEDYIKANLWQYCHVRTMKGVNELAESIMRNETELAYMERTPQFRNVIEPKCHHGNPEALCGQCAAEDGF